jgi:D-xylonolactonase
MNNTAQLLLQCQCELGEGAMWHTDEQALYWVDILRQQLWRYTPEADVQACWHMPQMLTAVLPTSDERLLLALADKLALFNPVNLSLSTVCLSREDNAKMRLNDATLDAAGDVWFGSMDLAEESPTGAFYQYANGQLLELHKGIAITNGPAISCDGTHVYFTDTLEQTIYRANAAEKSFANAQVFITFSDDEGHPDGMCTDTQGGLWVAHWGAGCVSRYLSDGTLDQRFSVPASNVTKCCFGGKNLNTLYITTARKGLSAEALAAQPLAGSVFSLETHFQGADLQPFQAGDRHT